MIARYREIGVLKTCVQAALSICCGRKIFKLLQKPREIPSGAFWEGAPRCYTPDLR